jgi:hypothetical protein
MTSKHQQEYDEYLARQVTHTDTRGVVDETVSNAWRMVFQRLDALERQMRTLIHIITSADQGDKGDDYHYLGYNDLGFDRSGFDIEGYDEDGYDRMDYDPNGYDRNGYDQQGYDKDGYNADGYDRTGFDREGYDKWGYDREGYNRRGLDQAMQPRGESGNR